MSELKYFLSRKDDFGCIYSIDNVIVEYAFESVGTSVCDLVLEKCRDLKSLSSNYYEKIDMKGVSKYYFAKDFVHLDDGITVYLGYYFAKFENIDVRKRDKTIVVLPLLKIELNPNKHGNKPIFKELIAFINSFPSDSYVVKYDLALDVPVKPDDIQVFKTKKKKAFFDNTRYFGRRNKSGYCKIYDKAKESGLTEALTRVEHTVDLRSKDKSTLEQLYILKTEIKADVKLSPNDMIIYELMARMRAAGMAYEDILAKVDFRKRKRLIEALSGCSGYVKYEYRQELIQELLEEVGGVFRCSVPEEPFQNVVVDYNPFVDDADDEELPFE